MTLLLLALVACTPVKTYVDYNPTEIVPSQTWKTYAWMAPKDPSRLEQDPVAQRRVHTAVDQHLAGRGYTQAPEGEADFLLGWHLSFDQQVDVEHAVEFYGYGYGGWGYGIMPAYGGSYAYDKYYGATPNPRGFEEATIVTTWTEGTLVLDVVDAAKYELAWRGMAKKRIKPGSRDEDQAQERVNEAVDLLLVQFPPAAD